MKTVEVFRWYLPPRAGAGPRAKPYLSRWKMTAEEAAARGALRPEPATRELRDVPETAQEQLRSMLFYQGVGRDGGVQPPSKD